MRLVLIAFVAMGWSCRELPREKCTPPLEDGGCPAEVEKGIAFCVCGTEDSAADADAGD